MNIFLRLGWCHFNLLPPTSQTKAYDVCVQWESSCNIHVTVNCRNGVNEMSQQLLSYVGSNAAMRCVNVGIGYCKFCYVVDPL